MKVLQFVLDFEMKQSKWFSRTPTASRKPQEFWSGEPLVAQAACVKKGARNLINAEFTAPQRLGIFLISREILRLDPALVCSILDKCTDIFPYCNIQHKNVAVQYKAICPDFDEVEFGQSIPEYDVVISQNGQKIEFKRVIK